MDCFCDMIRRGGKWATMDVQFVLTEYVEHALSQAVYHKLEDGSFAARIP